MSTIWRPGKKNTVFLEHLPLRASEYMKTQLISYQQDIRAIKYVLHEKIYSLKIKSMSRLKA